MLLAVALMVMVLYFGLRERRDRKQQVEFCRRLARDYEYKQGQAPLRTNRRGRSD